jgi:hypothetical protein
MSDMRSLLESMNKFAGQSVGQKPGDQVRGDEPMPKKGGGKKHPYQGRLVGGASESIEHDNDLIVESLKEEFEKFLSEYGAANTPQGANPQEITAAQDQQEAQKADIENQVDGLEAQVASTRSQVAALNRQFPTASSSQEKAFQLKDLQSQKVQLGQQIQGLMQQISALKRQA